MTKLLVTVVAISCLSSVVYGQEARVPRIATSASADVSVPAYKARFTVGAIARADKAKDAGARVAAATNSVRDALVKLGLDRNSLSSAGYSVGLEDTSGGRQPKTYVASSLLNVELTNLDQLGAVVDTALAAGATEVSEIQFLPKDADAARAEALTIALGQARHDAEAVAKAAGGRLGALIVASTDGGRASGLYAAVSLQRGAGTTISAPDVKVSASVQAEWSFEETPSPAR